MDIRRVGFLENLSEALDSLRRSNFKVSLLFLDAEDQILVR